MKRKDALAYARIAGYHNDSKAFCRINAETRVSYPALKAEWDSGVKAKINGVKCGCYSCNQPTS